MFSIDTQHKHSVRNTIILAFMELLSTKQFDMITVKEIVQKAGISRSSFYLHFHDKYELMEFLDENITAKFLSYYEIEKVNNGTDSTVALATTSNICQHVFEYRYFYQHQFYNPDYILTLANALSERLCRVYPDNSYAIFASYGTIGYLSFWVKGNFSINPQEAAKHLMKIGMTDWSKYTLH